MQRNATRLSRLLAVGLATAAAAGLIAYGSVQSFASSYRATSIVSVVPETSAPAADLRGAIYESQREAALDRHITGLRAQGTSRLLGDALGVSDRDVAARQLNVAQRGDEQVSVSVAATDPDRAVKAVNAVVDSYQASLEHAKRDESQALAVQKQQEIAAAEAALARAEQQLKALTAPAPDTPADALDVEISRLRAEIDQNERYRQHNKTRAAEIRTAIAEGRAERYASAETSPLVRQLGQVKAHISGQIAQMAKTLPPDHPRLQELSSDLSGVERQLSVQAVKAAEALEQELPALQQTEQRLKASLKSFQQQRSRRSGGEAARRDAERTVAAQRGALEALRSVGPVPGQSAIGLVAVERATMAVRVPNPGAQRLSLIAGALAFAAVAAAAILVLLTRSRA